MPDVIKVLIADDSPSCRASLGRIVAADPFMRIVSEVDNGRAAVEETQRCEPDVVLMDVMMPVIDGIRATSLIMQSKPVPIVIVSGSVNNDGKLNFQALEAGAVDVLRKPSREDVQHREARIQFAKRIRALSGVPVIRRRSNGPAAFSVEKSSTFGTSYSLIGIGASTGGPTALAFLLENLGATIVPPPIAVVQHISPGFLRGMHEWLEQRCQHLSVQVVAGQVTPEPGSVYIAADRQHLVVVDGDLTTTPVHSALPHSPSINAFFESFAKDPCASAGLGIILTGMGEDGAAGLLMLRNSGAHTIAQDEATSVVYGMPRVAERVGAAGEVRSLSSIRQRLSQVRSRQASD